MSNHQCKCFDYSVLLRKWSLSMIRPHYKPVGKQSVHPLEKRTVCSEVKMGAGGRGGEGGDEHIWIRWEEYPHI